MSSNPPKHTSASSTNNWLSSILRPRAASVSVETCLNVANADPAAALDARPVLPLLSSTQPLSSRLKHLKVFSGLCENYTFTHLENIFFTVQDILEPNKARESRHWVFEFMLACIHGQYNNLGMARVTFYNTLRNYDNWDDFYDMYRVLYALCKGGRDISGFEKNIGKLLISWLDITLQHVPHYPHRLLLTSYTGGFRALSSSKGSSLNSPTTTHTTVAADHTNNATDSTGHITTTTTSSSTIGKGTKATTATIPYLSDILHLLTVIAKFNFALFEEDQVTHMMAATQQAFYASNHADDITTCLAFCDVVVRYRSVPFGALKPLLKIICGTVTIPTGILSTPSSSSSISCWSIFFNLLRSHHAHRAILTLCNFLDTPLEPGSSAENLAEGAIALLTETAWDGTHSQLQGAADVYKVSDTVLLLYFSRVVQQGGKNNGVIYACVLKSLTILVANSEDQRIGLMDWDVVWDIVDTCTSFVLGMMDDSHQKQVLQDQLPNQHSGGDTIGDDNDSDSDLTYNAVHQLGRFLGRVYKLYLSEQYNGPAGRFMQVLYALRRYASESSATILLDYYETEHYFLPSSENWIELLLEITNNFFVSPPNKTTTKIRLRVLTIVEDVCLAVKGFYSELMYQRIVTPMMEHLAQEKDDAIWQKSMDLLVECLLDCHDEAIFDAMLGILKVCSQCRCSATQQNAYSVVDAGIEQRNNNPNSPLITTPLSVTGKNDFLHRSSSLSTRRKHPQSKTKATHDTQDRTLHPSTTSTTSSGSISSVSCPLAHGQCGGVSGACRITDLFETLLRNNNKDKCIKAYNVITQISYESGGLFCPFGGPQLVAVDLLLRLRCSPNHRVYVIEQVPVTEENNYVLAIRKAYDLRKATIQKQRENGPFGSIISQPSTSKERYGQSSPFILSYKKRQGYGNNGDDDGDEGEGDGDDTDAYSDDGDQSIDTAGSDGNLNAVLNINNMVKGYLTVLSDSPNWELVVFVARRLSCQLATKHMFCGARTSLRNLRRALVKWISSRNFLKQVTHIPPTVKRNDLNVHAYHILTALISYRGLFKKHAQDEMVYAFYIGITQVTAATTPCIHALMICCHELPLSIAKMLNEILQRMSQIISEGSVSVHILEFLSGLARLPNLYSNFVGDMYKPVFAIALNYLQHARSVTGFSRTGYNAIESQMSPPSTPNMNNSPLFNSPNTPSSIPSASSQHKHQQNKDASQQGAMSEYVLIMAYMVITVWFTAIPIRERRKHVPFIIQRLLAGNSVDEQTYTCIDMLSRFTFADISLSPHKSMVSNILMDGPDDSMVVGHGHGKSTKSRISRTWVYGHTLLTLKTAKALGWMEMTIRRSSGTVSLMCNIENNIKSNEIDYKTLPALLMMQYQPDLMAHRLVNELDTEQHDDMTDSAGLEKDGTNKHNQSMMEGEALGITFDGEEDDSAAETKTANVAPSLADHRKTSNILSTPTSPLSATSSTSYGRLDGSTSMAPKSPPLTSHQMTATVSSPSISSPLLSPLMKTPHLDKTKVARAQEERVHTIVRDILSDQHGEHGVSQQSRNIIRKVEPSLDPGFLYIQLNNYPDLTGSMEMLPPLPDDEATLRAIDNLDRIPVVDFHKIGVIYVGKGQREEVEILANPRGSPEYVKFLNGLGTIERLRGFAGNAGGLDKEMDIDGAFAYFWKDDVTEMVFHVATMMPTQLDRDSQCSGKKRHIGNDSVTIVYFDDDDIASEYAFDTLSGQFNVINIVVTPYSMSTESVSPSQAALGQENTFFKVTMQQRPDMPNMGPISEPKLISAQSLPGFVRLISLHANIFAQIFHRFGAGGKQEYVSNWRERLRLIRRVRDRILHQQLQLQQQQQPVPSSTNTATTSNNATSTTMGGAPITSASGTSGSGTGSAATTPNISNPSNTMPNLPNNITSTPASGIINANSTSTTPTLISLNSSKIHMENLFDFTRYT